MKLDRESLARLKLSLLAEPGDPRLVALLQESSAGQVMADIQRGVCRSAPATWLRHVASIDARVSAVIERADDLALRWITPGHNTWPHALDDLDHVEPINGATGRPLGLWLRGDGDLGQLCAAAVSVVGARDATSYGREVAADIAADLADAGITVVSGAAIGIDACAHRGAIAMDKPTVAVLAGGVDINYPATHTALLNRIAAEAVVVSEQLPGQAPLKQRFLSRNRIIAGLSAGTLVVEAARRSGSLNTLNWADQLGRVAMGVPGPVTSQASVGIHEAMRTGKAMVVTNGREVIEAVGVLGGTSATPPRAPETDFDRLSQLARRILDSLPWGVVRTSAQITADVGSAHDDVDHCLAQLTRLGLVNGEACGWSLQRRADLLC